MANAFDPYHKWLGIPSEDQPANHYRLLGIAAFESDADVIANAADARMAHVRGFQSGANGPLSQKLLNELANARVTLLNPKKKAAYDEQLRAERTPPAMPTPVARAVAVATSAGPLVKASRPSATTAVRQRGKSNGGLAAAAMAGLLLAAVAGTGMYLYRPQPKPPVDRPKSSTNSSVATSSRPTPDSDTPAGSTTQAPGRSFRTTPNGAGTGTSPEALTGVLPLSPAVAEPLETVRRELRLRDVGAARTALSLAERQARDVNDRAEVARHKQVATSLGRFWQDVAKAAKDLEPDQELKVDGRTFVVAVTKGSTVTIREPEAKREYRGLASVPAPLALKLAQQANAKEYQGDRLGRLAFLATDRDVAKKQAESAAARLTNLPVMKRGGLEEWSKLLPKLAAIDTQPLGVAMSGEEPESMDDPAPSPGETLARTPPPEAAALREAEARVRELFEEQIAEANTGAAKARLAQIFLSTASTTNDNPADKYALLVMARDLSAAGGDFGALDAAVEALTHSFEVDASAVKIEGLARMEANPAEVFEAALEASEEAADGENYDAALEAVTLAVATAKRAGNPALNSRAVEARKNLQDRQRMQEDAKRGLITLQENPDDGPANAAVGRYFSFAKQDWRRGLDYLRRGNDAGLRDLAEAETNAATAAEQQKLADGWLAAAKRGKPLERPAMLAHAKEWYKKALVDLTGVAETTVRERISEIDALELNEGATSAAGAVAETPSAIRRRRNTPLMHMIGIYTSSDDEETPAKPGVVIVKVTAKETPVVLVLSSYHPTYWRLDVEKGVRLKSVILGGFAMQSADGLPKGAAVAQFTRNGPGNTRNRNYFYAYRDDERFEDAVRKLTTFTRLPLTSSQFARSAAGQTFLISDALKGSSDETAQR